MAERRNDKLFKIILSSIFLAIGMVLPLLTAQVKEIGDSLLPMHIAVMLCAFLCGGSYGAAVGFLLPFLRSFIFGMPPIYPNAVWMAFEMCAYGLAIGFMQKKLKINGIKKIYVSLVTSQIFGRVVGGICKCILLGIGKSGFTFAAFISGGFVDALPGIVLQLVLVPFIVSICERYNNKNKV